MSNTLPHLEVGTPNDQAELSVILMHGLGADGHDFADVAAALCQAALPNRWRFVLPHAPEIPVTINFATVMPAWYDILSMDHPRHVDWDTVATSQRDIEALLEREQAPKIVLAGFSQGAAMALHVGLRHQQQIAGVVMMSGYLLESEAFPPPSPTQGTNLPIALFHGEDDPVVPLDAADSAFHTLNEIGFSPTFTKYPGLEHGVAEQEIAAVLAWLAQVQGGTLP